MEPKFKRRYYFPRKLLTWKDLSYLINLRPLMTAERTRFDTEEKYRWINHPWALDENCFPPVLLKDMLDNLLIYFVDMSRCTKKVNAFAERLEKKYDTPVDAHVYVDRCLNDTHPFGIHFDWNHNVIVQCEGITNFKVWEKMEGLSRESWGERGRGQLSMLGKKPLLDVDMKPGDVIWIPKYHPHLATSKTIRLSVSFPLAVPTEDGTVFQQREWVEL